MRVLPDFLCVLLRCALCTYISSMNVCLSCFDMVMKPVAILICAGCVVDVFCGSCVWCSVLVDAFVLAVLFISFSA